MKRTKTICTILFVVLFAGAAMAAGEHPFTDCLSADWGSSRTRLKEIGIDIGLNYTAEPAALVSGGYESGATYLHNIDARMNMDLAKLTGLKNTTFLMVYSSRSGDTVSEEYVVPPATPDGRYVYGEYFNKSQEAYGGQSNRLVNFQFSTRPTPQWQFDYGRLVMNDLFLRSDLYCSFLNNAVCGSPKGVFTPYALSAYPNATAGVHARYRAGSRMDVKLGVFDGGWTAKSDTHGLDWSLGENGAAFAGEVQMYPDRSRGWGDTRVIKIGINRHTGDFRNYRTGQLSDGHTSLYLLTDWMLMRESVDSAQGLSLFGAVVWNPDDEISALPLSANMGMVYQGLMPSRDRDRLGLMVTLAEHSTYNTYTHDFVSGRTRGNETIFELTYNIVLNHGIQIMPSLQHIIHPNGDRDFGDATVLGIRLSVNL